MTARIYQFPTQPRMVRVVGPTRSRDYFTRDVRHHDLVEFTPSTEPCVTDFIGSGEISDLIDAMIARNPFNP